MNLFTRLISGHKFRKSRLHDEKGNFAPCKNIAFHGGPAFVSGLLRLSIGYRPELPMIAYTSIDILMHFLNNKSRVLEFGSGMSTIWYAKQSGEVFSVEDYRPWYDKVSNIIRVKNLNNITYKFAEREADYHTFMSEDEKGFDLIMIDGSYRSKCISSATKLVKPGGILYLDNSDQDSHPNGGDTRIAEILVRDIAKNMDAKVIEITDFAPTQLFVKQALLIKLPG